VPQADATTKMGDNWIDPVTSHVPVHSGAGVASVLTGRSPRSDVLLVSYIEQKVLVYFATKGVVLLVREEQHSLQTCVC